MTILSVVGSKGPGPIEGEEPERVQRSVLASLLSFKRRYIRYSNNVIQFITFTTLRELILIMKILVVPP